MANTAPPMPVEGVLDRFRNGRELLKLLNSGLISEVLEIISLVPNGQYGEAVVDVGDVMILQGLTVEGEAVRNLGNAMIPKPFHWDNIAAAECDLQKVLLLRFLSPASNIPRMMARKAIADMTRAESKKWLSDNVANLREGRKAPLVRRYLGRNAPEVLDALDGKPQKVGMTPEQAEKIINILGWAILLANASSIFIGPGGIAIATALRAIQTHLKSMFPEVNALADFTPDGVDRGLDLGDFSPLA